MRRGRWVIFTWTGAVVVGCAGGATDGPDPGLVPTTMVGGFEVVADDWPPASDIEDLIAPYRDRMESHLAEVLGQAAGPFVKDDPEGALDNLVADALLDELRELGQGPVDVVLLNDGGLRVPIAEGPIRVRHAYELLPFENFVSVLTLSGAQLEALADQIARTGGEPIAGWTMVLEGEDARQVRVGGEPVDPEREYRLGTVDFLVDGGGSWSVLRDHLERRDHAVLIRDVFMEYVREEGVVTPTLDGRIVLAPGPEGAEGSRP